MASLLTFSWWSNPLGLLAVGWLLSGKHVALTFRVIPSCSALIRVTQLCALSAHVLMMMTSGYRLRLL